MRAKVAALKEKGVPYMEVRCAMCGWEWIAAYFPMPISDACRIMRTGHCPKCAADAKHILVFWDRDNPPAPRARLEAQ